MIIGKRARHVSRTRALDYVAGYACFNDGSIRDYQRHSQQFTPGKNFHHSGSFGPWLVTTDEQPDPAKLHLQTRLNGAVVQDESVGALCFDIPQLIEYCSTWAQLEPGDVLVTGTPGGVGAGRTPPLWMKAGDTVEVEIRESACCATRSWMRVPRNSLPRGTPRAKGEAARRSCCSASRSRDARGAAERPDLEWIDGQALDAGEVLVQAERGDRPLTVLVKVAAEIHAPPEAIWSVLTACQISPEYVPNVVSCQSIEKARRRPRGIVRAGRQGRVLSADLRARFSARLPSLPADRRAPSERAHRAEWTAAGGCCRSRAAACCWSTSSRSIRACRCRASWSARRCDAISREWSGRSASAPKRSAERIAGRAVIAVTPVRSYVCYGCGSWNRSATARRGS